MNDTKKPRKCQVILLDERRLEFSIQPKLMACDLLDMVASQFNLHEKEYFGLSYTDESNNQNWLRMDKRVIEHEIPRYQEPFLLNFSVSEDRVLSYYKGSAGQSRGETVVRKSKGNYNENDKSSIPWWLGFSPKGIAVYDHNDKIKPRKLFQWNQIENIYFRDRKLSLEIRDSYRSSSVGRKSNSPCSMMAHSWYACTAISAKTMWTMAISQHQFYLDKKKDETSAAATRTLRDVACELTESSISIRSSLISEISSSISSDYSQSLSTLDGEDKESNSSKAAEMREMAIALSARKDALMDKLKDKTEELQQLCIQEAALTGKYPEETPYIVGKPLPPIRKRIGTAFEFSDLVVSGDHDGIEEIEKQQMQIEIQSKITTAAKLREMEDQLNRLKREYLIMDDDDEDDDEGASSEDLVNGEPYNTHRYLSPNTIRQYRSGPTGQLVRKRSTASDIVRHEPEYALVNGAFHGSYPRLKGPPSPSSHSYQGFFDSPNRTGSRSPKRLFDGSRQGPAFQYSDSDTRSDSSTKHSSISSTYTNSEDFIDGMDTLRVQDSGERSPSYHRPMASSWDNHLDVGRVSRSPSPFSPSSRYGQSSESICSESYSPRSPSEKRVFSFGSALLRPPQRYSRAKYSNASDIAIVSQNGNSGTYSLGQYQTVARSGPNLADRSSYGSSSLVPDNRTRTGSSSRFNSSMPYLPNMENVNKSSSSFCEDHVLQWKNDDDQQATLV